MSKDEAPPLSLHFALVLLSAALIGFQLEQMQLLALLQWHHFAYLVISVALLGFGAGGTLIALCQAPLLRRMDYLLPLLLFGCAVMMALALPLSGGLLAKFDISLLFVKIDQSGLLLLGQLIFLVVFFLGAIPLGLVFIHYSSRISSLYCANLIGSGIGSIASVILMYFFLPQQLPGLTALLPWFAGILVTPGRRPALVLSGIVSLGVIMVAICFPPDMHPSQYKSISRTLDLPGARIVRNEPGPQGLVQLVTAPALRFAPGLSLTYSEEVREVDAAVFLNGEWFGAVIDERDPLPASSMSALPYALNKRSRVLVLQAGTGADVVQALANGAQDIAAVESNKKAVQVTSGRYKKNTGNPFTNPAVSVSFMEPRTFLALEGKQDRYDLITLPVVGSFGGSAGLFALQEQYLLTMEAFLEMWNHLDSEGVIRISAWLDSPPRNPLRLLATLAETLDSEGVDFHWHVAAVRGWDMITFILKRTPFSPEEIERIMNFCERLQFDPVFLPGLENNERERYHFSTDKDFFNHLDSLITRQGRAELYHRYDFALRPVTDSRPFFSQFLRWQNIPELVRLLGEGTVPYMELGYVLVLASFGQMAMAAVLLIRLPLLRLGLPGRCVVQRWTIPYFSGLAVGYMFFEIVMIHELVLFFGHPIFAAAAVIGSLLFFSGMGSLFSSRLAGSSSGHVLASALAAVFLLLYLVIMPPLLHLSIGWPMVWKILFFLLLAAPPAFVMGMPFPLALRLVAGYSKSQGAWAWGINGSMSVVSTGLAAIVAVESGFSAVMFIACSAYCLAAVAGWTGRTA